MESNIKVITEGLKRIGIKEFPGKSNNSPTILSYLKQLIVWANNDEISWCSAFANDVIKTVFALDKVEGIDATARSWMNYGTATDTPSIGDIVIFWRESPDSWKGHVGFYVRENDKYVWVLGGNQGDSVSISPYEKARVLSYRKHPE
jgi:uncharacterized protein (TIGR02594 family)